MKQILMALVTIGLSTSALAEKNSKDETNEFSWDGEVQLVGNTDSAQSVLSTTGFPAKVIYTLMNVKPKPSTEEMYTTKIKMSKDKKMRCFEFASKTETANEKTYQCTQLIDLMTGNFLKLPAL